jgi:arginase
MNKNMSEEPPRILQILSAAWGIGAQKKECRQGPLYLAEHHYLQKLSRPHHWQKAITEPKECSDAVAVISQMALQLARQVDQCVLNKEPFVTLGGDHSCAIGTWSGAAHALAPKGDLGLIWFDAHQDANTFATTPSNTIHGMPVACLLGHGEAALIEILQQTAKIKPEHLCLIGVRSYDEGEAALLKSLGVRCFMMDEVVQRGLEDVMEEAMRIVTQGTVAYGVSIDLDALDPQEAPGVGSREADGLSLEPLVKVLTQHVRGDSRFIGAEIAEFNPQLDTDGKTVCCILMLLEALFG